MGAVVRAVIDQRYGTTDRNERMAVSSDRICRKTGGIGCRRTGRTQRTDQRNKRKSVYKCGCSGLNMEYRVPEAFGEALGDEAYANKVSGIYGPAMNIHRTPFSGRNFEYYSEDALLSGKMGAAMVRGCNEKNVYTYINISH